MSEKVSETSGGEQHTTGTRAGVPASRRPAPGPRSTHRSLPDLEDALRLLAQEWRLPVELRGRLTQSVAALAGPPLREGHSVTLAARRGASELTVELRPAALAPDEAPALPPEVAGHGARWRLDRPCEDGAREDGARREDGRGSDGRGQGIRGEDRRAHDGSAGEAAGDDARELLAEELREARARIAELADDRQRLTQELAETNSGVLALYVQLEERDEQLRRAHGQTLRELEDALRPPPVDVPGLEMAIHYAPAGTDAPTGGDLYDWFRLPDGTVHITVVDALGHGVTSTRSALNVTHAVRTLALEGHPLGQIVARTDEILLPFDRELMATVQLVRIDPVTGVVRIANGSHPPALVARSSGATEYLEVRGRGIGYPLPGSERVREDALGPGDLLVLYTDGLTESRRDPRDGERRLALAAARHRGLPTEEVPGALAAEMHTVILHPDDTLALTVRRTGA
ncbi:MULTISPECIES: PP2C family protein-serine/threonine phosphatase [unclassified Streptomyces]|uniref:PP2C family protein-serine/threonine phosphatase n=1 Tax=unclassified Streptomyces TaxID=2593676 RepID=UPI0009982B41|nr:PP2C family protein-serine/threonine phosphatase [Streptomyces sp. NRRL F-5630]